MKAIYYALTALHSMICDRAMLLTDFFLATILPYILQYAIWSAVYDAAHDLPIEGFTRRQTLFYYAYALAFGRLNNGYDIIAKIAASVHEGQLEVYLTKPMAFPLQKLFGFLGESVLYAAPVLVIAIAQGLTLGFSSAPWYYPPCVVLSILASQVLCFAISFLLGVSSFWVVKADVLLVILIATSALLGGALLPPEFWSPWLRPIATYNPFRYMMAAPAELLVRPSIRLLLEATVATGLYIAAFGGAAAMLWRVGVRRYEGAGG